MGVKLTITITKSSQHQAFVKYFMNPKANHLISISNKNITVKNLSIYPKYSIKVSSFLRFTSSNAYKVKAIHIVFNGYKLWHINSFGKMFLSIIDVIIIIDLLF